jgi:hypothetical protein
VSEETRRSTQKESGMQRYRTPLFALALLMVMTEASPTSGGAQEATQAATPATEPLPPTQPTTGPGSSAAHFGGMTSIEQKPPDQVFADYWLFVPTEPLRDTTRAGEQLPLVIFVPGGPWMPRGIWRGLNTWPSAART